MQNQERRGRRAISSDYPDRSDDPTTNDLACRRCGRTVVRRGDRWTHIDDEGDYVTGCRAASFTTDDGWNDDLPRDWKAAAPEGVTISDAQPAPPPLWVRRYLEASIDLVLYRAVDSEIITTDQAGAIRSLADDVVSLR